MIQSAFRIPAPPPMRNHRNFIVSVSELGRFLAEQAEAGGAMILPETAGEKLLLEHGRVVGVRTGDKGIDKHGQPKSNYEPGVDIRAKMTILAEGPRGTLAKQLAGMFDLYAGRNPQVYSLGVKELWQLPDDRFPAGKVIHTMYRGDLVVADGKAQR